MAPRIMVREDPDVSAYAARRCEADGVNVLTGHKALRCEARRAASKRLVVQADGAEVRIPFDELLCAVGRRRA
jgi:pyruvate/2-oxoglutarate dehydrogenase complex dihydrolipoamide dehydrogenase (E3) component